MSAVEAAETEGVDAESVLAAPLLVEPIVIGLVEGLVVGELIAEVVVAALMLASEADEETNEMESDEVAVGAFEADELGMVAAKAEVAIASPQARAAMELLRWVCMVIDGPRLYIMGGFPD